MSAKRHVRFFLLRWHRRVGVVAALAVLVMVLTGIMINHSHDAGFDKSPLRSPVLLGLYGVSTEGPAVRYAAGRMSLFSWHGNLYADTREVGRCQRLLAVIASDQGFFAVCNDVLHLLSGSGELVDRLDKTRGFPDGVTGAGLVAGQPALRGNSGVWVIDPLTLDLTLQDESVPLVSAPEGVHDPEWARSIARQMVPSDITVERFLLDVHSGRFLGSFGPWILDAVGVLFFMLGASGFWLAIRRHRQGP